MGCLFYTFFSDSTSTDTTTSNTVGLKVGISFAVVVGAFIIAVVTAKLVNMCLTRRTIADDASDVSENTRNLIRTRLALIQLRKKDLEKSQIANIGVFFRRWSEKVKNRKKKRQKLPKTAKLVLTVENITEVKENKTSPRSVRLPIFSGPQNDARKSVKDIANGRKPAKVENNSPAMGNPVPSISAMDRPISSSPHILSSSPVDTSVLSSENKQTSKTVQIQANSSEPPDSSY